MIKFSIRNGILTEKINIKGDNVALKNRLWTLFYQSAFDPYDSLNLELTDFEKTMAELGTHYEFPYNRIAKQKNVETLKKRIVNGNCWWLIYELIEIYVARILETSKKDEFISQVNRILEEENSGYRMIAEIFVPITNELELSAVEETLFSSFDVVEKHMKKALSLYSDRLHPDYENCVKESISAVESMCCIITGESGKTATLGATLKKLEKHGIHIHEAMKSAFEKLYGYTSDENGIRHGGINFMGASSDDARYMLISCSAFINYLTAQYTKMA